MWGSSGSEYRCTGWSDRAALGDVDEPLAIALLVLSIGVWQCAQPASSKTARPFEVDGVSGAGVGGASIRMKLVKASTSEITAVGVAPGAKLTVSSGVALNRQPGVSSRFWGNSWFVTPDSTL